MSQPRTGTGPHWPGDLEGEAVVVKRYRFGARQALWLSLAAVFSFALVNIMFAPDHFAEPPGWLEANQTAPVLEARSVRETSSSEISHGTYDDTLGEPSTQRPKNVWKKDRAKMSSRARAFFAEAGRILERTAVNKAFAKLDLNDRNQVRTFLVTYGRSQYAHQQGYTQAITRRGLEEDLYGTGEIIACEECWCWQSQPAHAGPPALVD